MFDPKCNINDIRRFQSDIRSVIRKSNLTRCERDVCLALVSLWWGKNKNSFSSRGLGVLTPIYPGAKRISNVAKVNLRTAYRALKVLKSLNVFKVVGNENGGLFSARIVICFGNVLLLEKYKNSQLNSTEMSDPPPDKCQTPPLTECQTVLRGIYQDLVSADAVDCNVIKFRPNPKLKGRVL